MSTIAHLSNLLVRLSSFDPKAPTVGIAALTTLSFAGEIGALYFPSYILQEMIITNLTSTVLFALPGFYPKALLITTIALTSLSSHPTLILNTIIKVARVIAFCRLLNRCGSFSVVAIGGFVMGASAFWTAMKKIQLHQDHHWKSSVPLTNKKIAEVMHQIDVQNWFPLGEVKNAKPIPDSLKNTFPDWVKDRLRDDVKAEEIPDEVKGLFYLLAACGWWSLKTDYRGELCFHRLEELNYQIFANEEGKLCLGKVDVIP